MEAMMNDKDKVITEKSGLDDAEFQALHNRLHAEPRFLAMKLATVIQNLERQGYEQRQGYERDSGCAACIMMAFPWSGRRSLSKEEIMKYGEEVRAGALAWANEVNPGGATGGCHVET